MLTRLAHVTVRHRWAVIGCWLVLVVVGGFAAGKVSTRWYQSFSIPGQSAYEASQRTLAAFGAGVRPPSVVVFHTDGDATKSRAIAQAMRRAAATVPGARSSSYFSTGNPAYVSRDRHTTFMELYPPGPGTLNTKSGAVAIRAAAASGLPAGITVNVTGHDPLEEASTARIKRRLERPRRGPDRRPRRARDPAVRLRNAAGRADPARRRARRRS